MALPPPSGSPASRGAESAAGGLAATPAPGTVAGFALRMPSWRWSPSGAGGEGSDAGERADEVVLPGPAGREVQRPAAGAGGEPAGEREQAAADGASGADRGLWESDHAGSAQQVVGEAGDHGPGGVGVEAAGGEVRERLVFEVADRELDDGVLAVLGPDVSSGSVRLVMNGK